MNAQLTPHEIRGREELAPNSMQPVPFMVPRACRIVDVTGLPPDVVVVRAAMGKRRYSRDEARCSFAESLAAEPYEANAGAYCVFTVMNLGKRAVPMVTANVIVADERGEPVKTSAAAPKGTSANDVAAAAARAAESEADARLEALLDAATTAPGGTGRPSTGATRKRTPAPTQSTTNGSPAPTARAASPARTAPPSKKPAPDAPRQKKMIPKPIRAQRVLSLKERKARLVGAGAATAPQAVAPPSPPPTAAAAFVPECFVVLDRGYTELLELLFVSAVPLANSMRAGIVCALDDVVETDPRTPGPTEIMLALTRADYEALLEAIETRGEFTLEADGVTAALCRALRGEEDEVTPAPEPVSPAPALAAPSSVPPPPPHERKAAAEPLRDEPEPKAAAEPQEQSAPPPHESKKEHVPVVDTDGGSSNVVPIGPRRAEDDGRPERVESSGA